ncbi:MAG: hypothetical protein MI723_03240 [Caulobacterales bacterium]|nr:hypothetical protein [Caulobacterales bacterium]
MRPMFLAACVGAVLPVPAQAAGSFTRTVEASVDSAYLFRGTQRGEGMVFVDGEIVLNGVYLAALAAAPFGEGAETLPTELRGYVGYSPHLEDRGSPFDLDAGVAVYAFPEDSDVLGDDTRVEVFGGVVGLVPLNPALYGYYDFELETFTVEGGVTQYLPLGGLRGVELALDAGYVEPDAGDGYSYAEAGADLVQGFGAGLEGYVGARAAVTSEELLFDDLDEQGPELGEDFKAWVTGGVRLTF